MSDVFDLPLLHDTVTWWQRTGTTGGGSPTFAAPVAIKGRWNERNEIFRSAGGGERVSQAVVPVDRDMAPGDYLKAGVWTDADPLDDTVRALLVDGWRKTSSIGGGRFVRRAFLV